MKVVKHPKYGVITFEKNGIRFNQQCLGKSEVKINYHQLVQLTRIPNISSLKSREPKIYKAQFEKVGKLELFFFFYLIFFEWEIPEQKIIQYGRKVVGITSYHNDIKIDTDGVILVMDHVYKSEGTVYPKSYNLEEFIKKFPPDKNFGNADYFLEDTIQEVIEFSVNMLPISYIKRVVLKKAKSRFFKFLRKVIKDSLKASIKVLAETYLRELKLKSIIKIDNKNAKKRALKTAYVNAHYKFMEKFSNEICKSIFVSFIYEGSSLEKKLSRILLSEFNDSSLVENLKKKTEEFFLNVTFGYSSALVNDLLFDEFDNLEETLSAHLEKQFKKSILDIFVKGIHDASTNK